MTLSSTSVVAREDLQFGSWTYYHEREHINQARFFEDAWLLVYGGSTIPVWMSYGPDDPRSWMQFISAGPPPNLHDEYYFERKANEYADRYAVRPY